MANRKSQHDVVSSFRLKHGDRYNYDFVGYVTCDVKVDIRCRECGKAFMMRPRAHLQGQGCPDCGMAKMKAGKLQIVEKAWKDLLLEFGRIHGGRYDYCESEYHGADKRIRIMCTECGRRFWSFPHNHRRGKGCQFCSQKRRATKRIKADAVRIIDEFRKVHNNKYDYGEVDYRGANIGVKIRCLDCGNMFIQFPGRHRNGDGCKKCADRENGNKRLNAMAHRILDDFVSVHGDRYDYSRIKYKGDAVKMEIICRKCGRSFWQSAGHHKGGNGCPWCRESHGESAVAKALEDSGIEFERQKRFPECRNRRTLPFDFFFRAGGKPVVVEYNGRQHYEPVSVFGGIAGLKGCSERDRIKKKFCEERGIGLIEIGHDVPLGKVADVLREDMELLCI